MSQGKLLNEIFAKLSMLKIIELSDIPGYSSNEYQITDGVPDIFTGSLQTLNKIII